MRIVLAFLLWAFIVFYTSYGMYEPIDRYMDEQTCTTDAECEAVYDNLSYKF